MPKLRVVLVDDNVEFLESAVRFLASESIFEIVGQAQRAREALKQIGDLQPDLVLVDWAMPEMNGLDLTRALKARANAPRVVILTQHDISNYRQAAYAAGADGFVTKAEFGTHLLPMISSLFGED